MELRASVFARPPRFRGMSGSVLPFLFGKPRGSGFTALQTAAPPQLDGSRIFINSDPILNLARSDIDDQLAELDGIARALETAGCHGGNMAW
jgi:hypothetical protein